MTTVDQQRLALLHDVQRIEFAKPVTVQQCDFVEHLKSLTPQQRTELHTDMFVFWHTWHTQYALAAAGGL